MDRRPRWLVWFLVVVWGGVYWVSGLEAAWSAPIAVVAPVSGAVWLVLDHRWRGWRRPARRLLAEGTWRSVPARVLRAGTWWRRDVVEVDGTVVAAFLFRAHQVVIARTGRVWVMGPGTGSTRVLVVDGARTLAGARPTTAPRDPLPVEPGGDPFAPARAAVWDVDELMRASYLGCAAVCGALAVASKVFGEGMLVMVTGAMAVFLLVLSLVDDPRADRQAERMADEARWTPVGLRLTKQHAANSEYILRADGVITTVAGNEVGVSFRFATVDFFGAVADGRPLHLSGPPEPGKHVLAAFPEVPAMALVRIDRVRRSGG
jgi:hypothetical protein